MRALKIQIIPTKRQYRVLDEMFGKWASLSNRISLKDKSKEDLIPKINFDRLQFSKTQLNQIEKDVEGLQKAMKGLEKQKKQELEDLIDRRSKIDNAIENENDKERDQYKPSNIRPKGWRKFHTVNHWKKEIEKLDRQIKRKTKTIGKIEKGRIYFQAKKLGLWNDSSYEINFNKNKIRLKPFENKRDSFEVNLITEPIQPSMGSSLKSKKFLNESISNFIIESIHDKFFGLNQSEKYLIPNFLSNKDRDISNNDFIIVPFKKQEREEIEDFFNKKIESIQKKLTWTIGRGGTNTKEKKRLLNDDEKEILRKNMNESLKLLNSKEPIDWKNKENIKKLREDLRKSFSGDYLELTKKFLNELTGRKIDCLSRKKRDFENKVVELNDFTDGKISEKQKEIFRDEADVVYNKPNQYSKHKYSDNYLTNLKEIADLILSTNDFYDTRKPAILIRKPTNKIKKIHNLKPNKWKYYIQFGYEHINVPKLDTKNILGIDRGITHLLAYSVFEPESKNFTVNKLESNPIFGWKWRLRKLKRSLQNLERRMRKEKGIKLQENQMKKRIKSIENKIENVYHNVSRKIVNLAKKKNADIVFERLEGSSLKQHGRKKSKRMKGLNYHLSLFDYGKIANLIQYKAEHEGIAIWDIDQAYTSQNCAKCLLENGEFEEPKRIIYWNELKKGEKLNKSLLDGTGIDEAIIRKISKKKIELFGKDEKNNSVNLQLKLNSKNISFSRGEYKEQRDKNGKIKIVFDVDEELAEFPIKRFWDNNIEKIAILEYSYSRRKEKIGKKGKYTGNTKAGYCAKQGHGQVDADLNASRVIALCKYFGKNEPRVRKMK